MVEAFPKNFIDYEEYPASAEIQNRCVSMIARLFNVPVDDENQSPLGTSTVGSSEAIMLRLVVASQWRKRLTAMQYARHEEAVAKPAQGRWKRL